MWFLQKKLIISQMKWLIPNLNIWLNPIFIVMGFFCSPTFDKFTVQKNLLLLMASSFHVPLSLPMAASVPLCVLEDRGDEDQSEFRKQSSSRWMPRPRQKSLDLWDNPKVMEDCHWSQLFGEKSLRYCLICFPGNDLNPSRKVYHELKGYIQV